MTGSFLSDDGVTGGSVADSLSHQRKQSLIQRQPRGAPGRNNGAVGSGQMIVEPRYLLPPSAYRSTEWFERERATLFTDRWSLVADSTQLAEVGDYVAATVGDA